MYNKTGCPPLSDNDLRSHVDDIRIKDIQTLIAPEKLLQEVALDAKLYQHMIDSRTQVHRVVAQLDDRLMVVVGPCSIHDSQAAIDYAKCLSHELKKHEKDLLIVMRVYFEKPRTTIGWKGLINDPDLNESFNINKGVRCARQLLIDINRLGLPVGNEFLDMIAPQYYADLVSWGAIGARTTESQIHRELASGLSCAVGFKNGTDGNYKIAVDAIRTARHPHCFLSVNKLGNAAIVRTQGNEDTHIILRGGYNAVNYRAPDVEKACQTLGQSALMQRVMIDCSHANSMKNFKKQLEVVADISSQLAAGETRIFGVMIESNLEEGRQDLKLGEPLVYGKSITDACLGWDDTVKALNALAQAVQARRVAMADEGISS